MSVSAAYREFWAGKNQHELVAGSVPWGVASSAETCRGHWDMIVSGGAGDAVNGTNPKILEVGCGVGRLGVFIQDHLGLEYHGIDISEEMLATCRAIGVPRVRLIHDDGSFPCANDKFDFAFSFLVFQHMPFVSVVRKTITEAFRVLKPGCVFRVQTHRGQPHPEDSFGGWHGCFYPDADAFCDEFRMAGFSILKTHAGLGHSDWIWVSARKPVSGSPS